MADDPLIEGEFGEDAFGEMPWGGGDSEEYELADGLEGVEPEVPGGIGFLVE